MHFSVRANALQEAIKVVSHATTHSASTPILENTLITAKNGKVVLTSNNLEMAIEAEVEEVKVLQDGQITVSHRFLASFASLISDDDVEVKLETGNTIHFTTKSNTTKFKGIDANEFPVIPTVRKDVSFHIEAKHLREAFSKTLFSSAQGNVRPTLAGVYLSVSEGKIIFASTDSFRLSEYQVKNSINLDKPVTLIIPARTANELTKLLPDDANVEVFVTENQLLILFDSTKVFSRLLNGHFPDYKNFFPQKYSTKGIARKSELAQALKQVSLISRENNYNTKMFFHPGKGMELDTGDTEVGAGKVTVNGDVEGVEDGIGVNSVYLLDVLGVITEEYVSLDFETNLAPVMVQGVDDNGEEKDEQFRHIIMPLKI